LRRVGRAARAPHGGGDLLERPATVREAIVRVLNARVEPPLAAAVVGSQHIVRLGLQVAGDGAHGASARALVQAPAHQKLRGHL
jgi:hypothetical protein